MDEKDKIIAAQAQLIEELRVRIGELERRLGLNSSNSGKPPSSDGLRKKPAPQSLRPKGKKPSGGQVGHKGTTLEQVQHPDIIEIHKPEICARCGEALLAIPEHSVIKRQIFEITKPRLVVTEHQSISKRCPCGCITVGQFPESIAAPVQYGKRIQSTLIYYLNQQMIPEDRLQQLMIDMHGISIATGTMTSINARFSRKVAPIRDKVLEAIKNAPVKNVDETGFRIGGKTQWLQVISTDSLTHYRVSCKRKDLEPLSGIKGTVVHDHWKPYFQLEGITHALCNAHHLRELKSLIEIEKESWANHMSRLLTTALRLKDPPIERISRLYDQIIERGLSYHNALPQFGRTKHKKRTGHNLLLRLCKYKDAVLRFLTQPEVPFTNNQAEQDIRMMKVKQKISGGFRTLEGAQIFATIRGFISTSRKQGLNTLDSIQAQFI
jgi:transposase